MLEIRNKCPPYFVQAEVRKLLMYLTVSKRLISFISFIPSQPVSICQLNLTNLRLEVKVFSVHSLSRQASF